MVKKTLQATRQTAAALWTGGKDSCLALYDATQMGYQVEQLVTFVPAEARFRAHPLDLMRLQSEALDIPHRTLVVQGPYERSYRDLIRSLREGYGVGTLIAGDRGPVDGHPNWIRECAQGTGAEVLTPLWGSDGVETLDRFIRSGFKAVLSCVRKPWLAADWLGRELDRDTLEELRGLAQQGGFDICGEQGEYHTLVLNGPLFTKRICIDGYEARTEEDLSYLLFHRASTIDK